jgi:predicted transcriptional regulator
MAHPDGGPNRDLPGVADARSAHGRSNAADAGASAAKDRVRRFLTAFNEIDGHLRAALGHEAFVPFGSLINASKQLKGSERQLLQQAGELRNVLVHGYKAPLGYPAIPEPSIVAHLEAARDRLLQRRLAIPTFSKRVESVQASDSLAHVLRLINERDFSQFPVYADERFLGLLTENGITRWLAHHVVTTLTLVDLADVPVRSVFREEEKRRLNYAFAARKASVYQVRDLFVEQALLEAVLINETGRPEERLLGMATRWDLLQLKFD